MIIITGIRNERIIIRLVISSYAEVWIVAEDIKGNRILVRVLNVYAVCGVGKRFIRRNIIAGGGRFGINSIIFIFVTCVV